MCSVPVSAMSSSQVVLLFFLIASGQACLPQPTPATTPAPDAGCTFYGPSPSNPTSVAALRPGDIGIIGVLGDSDAAAFGARAKNIIFIFDENREISFASGTSSNYVGQTSLANMLQQYNPDLAGGSTGSNNLLFNQDYQTSQGLNYAVSGEWAQQAPAQTDRLVAAIQQEADWQTKWKLITVQFGGNDICTASCTTDPSSEYFGDTTPQGWRNNMAQVLDKLKALPNTLVVFTESHDYSQLLDVVNPSFKCSLVWQSGCPCITAETRAEMTQLRDDYTAQLKSLAAEYSSSTFGVEVVPALAGLFPTAAAGGPDTSYFAPDCFHFNEELHSMIGKNLWNNLIEPADSRTTNYNPDTLAIKCPQEGDFLSTTQRSAFDGAIDYPSTV